MRDRVRVRVRVSVRSDRNHLTHFDLKLRSHFDLIPHYDDWINQFFDLRVRSHFFALISHFDRIEPMTHFDLSPHLIFVIRILIKFSFFVLFD